MKSNKYSATIFKSLTIKIIIYSIVFTIIFGIIAILSMAIAGNYIWYPEDPLYILLSSLKKNILLIWGIGIVIILIYY